MTDFDPARMVLAFAEGYSGNNPGQANEVLRALYEKAKILSSRFPKIKIVHVRREYNKEADKLAKQAIAQAARKLTFNGGSKRET
jgi:ribonuclease HI